MNLEGIDRVKNFIEKYRVKAEILEFKETVETVHDASRVSGYSADKILKTMVVIVEEKPYIIILSGDKKLDFKKLSKELNVRNVRLAKPSEVEKILNVKPGEVSPFLDEVLRCNVIIDKSVVDKGEVLVGGGSLHHLVKTHVDEIIKVLKPSIKNISKVG